MQDPTPLPATVYSQLPPGWWSVMHTCGPSHQNILASCLRDMRGESYGQSPKLDAVPHGLLKTDNGHEVIRGGSQAKGGE